MRVVRSAALVALLALAACADEHGGGAAWARLPAHHVDGDGTVGGTPAAVPRLAHAPVIDGRIGEGEWRGATVLGPFVDPGDGSADRSAIAPSFARVGWDDHALYFAFVVHDGSPAQPFDASEVDPHVWERSSAVEVMLQPGDRGDNRDYFEMQYDTKGAAFDSAWDDYNVPIHDGPGGRVFGHMDWSSHAERRATVANGAYALEVAIPWDALTKDGTPHRPQAGETWRLDLYAFRDGQSVANAWSPIRGEGNFHKSSRWGRIRFE